MQDSPFPLEIYGEIAEHASMTTLLALSLTCHALRSEAEKRLYRKVDIFIDTTESVAQRRSKQLLKMFERLICSPRLLQTVQELCLFDYERGDKFLDILSQSSSYDPFQQMTHLKSLRMDIDGPCFLHVLSALSSANIQLFSFCYRGWLGFPAVMDALSTLFRTQNQLEELELEGAVLFDQEIKSIEGLLPRNVKTLTSTPYALATCFPRLPPRCLLRLSIYSVSDSMPDAFPRLDGLEVLRVEYLFSALLQGCQSSFVTLRYLEATTQDFEIVIQHLPSLTALQKLKLRTDHSSSHFHPRWEEEMDNDDVNGKAIRIYHTYNLPARSFAACRSLQVFEISDFPHAFYSATSQTWSRGDKLGTSTTWEVDEWKYSWPR